jgi:type II secretory pathway component PulJ
MKKAIVLVEVILSIAIFSIIALVTTKTAFSLYKHNTLNQSQTYNNLKLESTRLFLIKNNDFSKVKFENSSLYYDNNLLLHNIESYSSSIQNNINTIDICIYIKTKDKICQTWKIKVS